MPNIPKPISADEALEMTITARRNLQEVAVTREMLRQKERDLDKIEANNLEAIKTLAPYLAA